MIKKHPLFREGQNPKRGEVTEIILLKTIPVKFYIFR
jgi:hypothetical protein